LPLVCCGLAFLGTLGFVCFQMGKFDKAEAFLREGIRFKQALGDLAGAADALFNLAMAMLWLGEFEEVDRLLAPTIASFTKTGAANEATRLQALQVMAQTLLGRYTEALEIAEAGLYYARTSGLEREMGILLWVLGYLSIAAVEYDKAEKQLLESTRILQSLGLLDILASAQVARGYAALDLNDLGLAYHHFSEAIPRRPDTQSNGVVILALPGIALLMARSGNVTLGIELDALAAHYPLIANSRFFEEDARLPLAALFADMPDEEIAQARARAEKLDLETAILVILDGLRDMAFISI